MIKKLILVLLILYTAAAFSQGQGYTNLTGTYLPYGNGSITASFVNQSGAPQLPLLNGSVFQTQANSNFDSFGNMSLWLADNNIVSPQPNQWKITACQRGGSQPACCTETITVTGSSQSMTSFLNTCPVQGGGGGGGGGSPAGPNVAIQWNNLGQFGGSSGLLTDTATHSTLLVGANGYAPDGLIDPRSVTCNAVGNFHALATTGTISGGNLSTVTLSSGVLTSNQSGQTAVIHNASGPPIIVPFTYVSATQMTLSSPAPNAVSGAWIGIGTDDTTSLQTCITAAITQQRAMKLPTPIGTGNSYLITKSLNATDGLNFYIVGDSPTFGFNHSMITAALTEAYPALDMSGSGRSGAVNIAIDAPNDDPNNSLATGAFYYRPATGGQSPLFLKLINDSFISGNSPGSAGCVIEGIDQVTVDGTTCRSNYIGLVGGDSVGTAFATTSKFTTPGGGFGCTLFRIDNSNFAGSNDTVTELEGCDVFQIGGNTYNVLLSPLGGGSAVGGFIGAIGKAVAGTGYAAGDTFSIAGGTGGVGTVVTVSSGIPSLIAMTKAGNGYSNTLGAATTALTGSGTGLTVNIAVNTIIELHQSGGFESDQLIAHNLRTENQTSGAITGSCALGLNANATRGGSIEGEPDVDSGAGFTFCGPGVMTNYQINIFTSTHTLFGNLGGLQGSTLNLENTPTAFGTVLGNGAAVMGNTFHSFYTLSAIEAGLPANPGVNYMCPYATGNPCQWFGSPFTVEGGIAAGSLQTTGNASIGGNLSVASTVNTGLGTNLVRNSYNLSAGTWTLTGSCTVVPNQPDSFGTNTASEIIATGACTLQDINVGSVPTGAYIDCIHVWGNAGGETVAAGAQGFAAPVYTMTTAKTQAPFCTFSSRNVNSQLASTITITGAETIFVDGNWVTSAGAFSGSFANQWTGAVPAYLPTTGTAVSAATPFFAEGNVLIPVTIPVSLTTTAATSDNVTVIGMTSSGHCSLAPTNASAATNLATTYVSAKTTNQITVTHTATASMTYDFLCTTN